MKREIAIAKARIAGYENDTRAFTRLLVESRVRRDLLNEAWRNGRSQAESGRSKSENHGLQAVVPAEESDEEFARQIEEMS